MKHRTIVDVVQKFNLTLESLPYSSIRRMDSHDA